MPCMSYQEAVERLKEVARQNHLSQGEIAKRAHLSDSQVSRIFSMESTASTEALTALALAVGDAPESVLRMAKRLPIKPDTDPVTEEGIHILHELQGEYKEDAVRYLRMRREVQEERERGNARGKKRPATSG